MGEGTDFSQLHFRLIERDGPGDPKISHPAPLCSGALWVITSLPNLPSIPTLPGAERAQSPAQEEGEESPGAPLQRAPLHPSNLAGDRGVSPRSQPGAAALTVCVALGQGKCFILMTVRQLHSGSHPEGKAPLPTGSHTQSLAFSKKDPPEMNRLRT